MKNILSWFFIQLLIIVGFIIDIIFEIKYFFIKDKNDS
jgi:hypothetical protein